MCPKFKRDLPSVHDAAPTAGRPPGRPASPGTRGNRRSAAETRERMVEDGLRKLADLGLTPSVDDLTLDRAARATDIARSSAYNAWTGHTDGCGPQEAYQREVIRRTIMATADEKDTSTLFAEASAVFARADDMARPELEKELIRIAGEAHYQGCLTDQGLLVGQALLAAAATTDSPLATEIIEWSRLAEDAWRSRLIDEIFEPFMEFMGRRPKPEFDPEHVWEQFVAALNAVGAGIVPRTHVLPSNVLYGIEREGPDGAVREWSLFAVVLEGLIDTFFERADVTT